MPGEQQAAQLSPHDAAMVAKVDAAAAQVAQSAPTPIGSEPGAAPSPQTATPPVTAPERPADVPEKFWDAEKGSVNTEALLKSYLELESGKAPSAGAQPPAQGDPAAQAAAAAQAAGLDAKALAAEFAQAGKLSDASYSALEKAGFDKSIVDSYIAGQAALAQKADAEGFELAGGKEAYAKMGSWAQQNLAPAEIEAFDAAVTGTPAQRKQAIVALKAQYEAAMGTEPTLLGGQTGAGQGSAETPFASRAEVTAAMRDPRYKTDSAYRAMVERRVGLMDNF